jgi:hypothetical protein
MDNVQKNAITDYLITVFISEIKSANQPLKFHLTGTSRHLAELLTDNKPIHEVLGSPPGPSTCCPDWDFRGFPPLS